ncbi:hypothetical protein EJ06DRAFT_557756 [Trichodelitschia bisporula]|uniref:Uncharacterized protein n=1 Tax=Trichodelitschia bisporula TaxID=703511 RepID=A0A6G1HTR6_9PEZI|nr:hypothetical protein EJ06DRAFT_557756 [Trichodelitschia bisporula]
MPSSVPLYSDTYFSITGTEPILFCATPVSIRWKTTDQAVMDWLSTATGSANSSVSFPRAPVPHSGINTEDQELKKTFEGAYPGIQEMATVPAAPRYELDALHAEVSYELDAQSDGVRPELAATPLEGRIMLLPSSAHAEPSARSHALLHSEGSEGEGPEGGGREGSEGEGPEWEERERLEGEGPEGEEAEGGERRPRGAPT